MSEPTPKSHVSRLPDDKLFKVMCYLGNRRFLPLKRPSSCNAKSEEVKSNNSASMKKKKKAIGAQDFDWAYDLARPTDVMTDSLNDDA